MEKNKDLFYTNLIYFIIMVIFVCVRICTAMNVFSFLGVYQELILTIFTQVGILLVFPLMFFSKLNNSNYKITIKKYNFRKINFKSVIISILIGLIVFILNIFISSFFSFILTLLGYSYGTGVGVVTQATWGNFFLSLFLVAFLPAVCEEFTHRGLLLYGYKKLGIKKAVILSGLLFGLLHLNIGQFFYATIIGIILAIITFYSRSIFPAMIIHFINNGLNVYIDFAKARGYVGGDFYSVITSFATTGNLFVNIVFVCLLLLFLLSALVYLIGILLRTNAQQSIVNYAQNMTLLAMREEVLKDTPHETKKEPINLPLIIFKNSQKNSVSLKIPYEALGFYVDPIIKPTKLDKLFYYASIILGSLITLFTFIWGIL